MIAPEQILNAALQVLYVAAYNTRNWTIRDDVPRARINDLWEAIHEIPFLLKRWRPNAEDELMLHLGEYDQKWQEPGLMHIYEDARKNPSAIGNRSIPSAQPFSGSVLELCDIVRETAFAVHQWFRHGQFEKIYENSLVNRLRKAGLDVRQQHPLPVHDEDGTRVGDYLADLLIDGRLIVELKTCKAIADEHVGQVLGYLRASGMEHGLLINFGTSKLQVKKLVLSRN